ncbi:MAG: lytic transglycosylase domain-containing protein [Nitrospirota bacterium]
MVDGMLRRIRSYGYILGLAGLAVAGFSCPDASAETIYRFVDANGVLHLSNAPTDPRYQKVQEERGRTVAQAPTPAPIQSFAPAPSILAEERTGETIYQYMDSNGVVHFSNVPTNPRYKRLRGERTLARLKPTLPASKLNEAILHTSHKHSLSPALVHAVIRAESAYNPNAVSSKGAMGLMQLMPGTASLLKVSNPYDPEENISGGVRYLRYLLDRFGGNLELALAAYNAGESRVLRTNQIPRISETQQYVRKVIRFYLDFSKEGIGARPTRTYDAETPPLVTRRFVNYLSPN